MSRSRIAVVFGNVRWGVIYGLMYAAVGSLLVATVAIIRGQTHFAQYGVSLATVILTYMVAGISAGIVIGLLRPWIRHPVGATVVGAVAGIPVMLACFVASSDSPQPWTNIDWQGVFFLGVLLGAPFGYLRWRRTQAKNKAS